ncbi:MAG: ATP-dependent RecD-like DNA helicase [Peptococcaceae bacterium]|nr:ATP-dependent RecD-like DNA helicase [Peptococcaceae bacterium]
MEINGQVTKIIYSGDNFMVANFKTRGETIRITGPMFGISEKEEITVRGQWVVHPIYGRQFKVETWEKVIPTQRTEVIRYLGNLVGKVTAQNIVDCLGENCISTILEQGPGCLLPISGIAEKRAQRICRKINDNFESYRVVARLLTYGLTAHTAMKAYRHFGPNAANLIGFNPYLLTELSMVGFEAADKIAIKIGIEKDSPFRIKAAICYVLSEAMAGGHCFLFEGELAKKVVALLKCDVDDDVVKKLIPETEGITVEAGAVYFKTVYHAERNLADCIRRLAIKRKAPDVSRLIKEYESRTGMTLAAEQRQAVREIVGNDLLLLVGGPGTGKTETLRAIYHVFSRLHPGGRIGAAALSGRAAGRIREATGINAVTLHSLLGMKPDGPPEYSSINPLPHDLLIVDEASMIDLNLAYNFFTAVKKGAKVLLVGDNNQLPSVGPGRILADLISAGLPRVELKYNFRQAEGSSIVSNAHLVVNGRMPEFNNRDCVFLHRDSYQEAAATAVEVVRKLIERGYDRDDIQVISPGKKHESGTRNLNLLLQDALNRDGRVIEGTKFRIGDRVIQTKNNYAKGVANGDVGVIVGEEDGEVTVKYFDREVIYDQDELDEVALGYAITAHKSQGSEYKAVVMVLTAQHYVLLARNLLYTAMTRPKEKLVVIGTKKALGIAVRNNRPVMRNTRLQERLLGISFLSRPRTKEMQDLSALLL